MTARGWARWSLVAFTIALTWHVWVAAGWAAVVTSIAWALTVERETPLHPGGAL